MEYNHTEPAARALPPIADHCGIAVPSWRTQLSRWTIFSDGGTASICSLYVKGADAISEGPEFGSNSKRLVIRNAKSE